MNTFARSDYAILILENETYKFINLKIRKDKFTQELYVNTPEYGFSLEQTTRFEQPLPAVEQSLIDASTVTTDAEIVGLKTLTKFYSCSSCAKKAEVNGKVLKMHHLRIETTDK